MILRWCGMVVNFTATECIIITMTWTKSHITLSPFTWRTAAGKVSSVVGEAVTCNVVVSEEVRCYLSLFLLYNYNKAVSSLKHTHVHACSCTDCIPKRFGGQLTTANSRVLNRSDAIWMTWIKGLWIFTRMDLLNTQSFTVLRFHSTIDGCYVMMYRDLYTHSVWAHNYKVYAIENDIESIREGRWWQQWPIVDYL